MEKLGNCTVKSHRILVDWYSFTLSFDHDVEQQDGWSLERNAFDTMIDFMPRLFAFLMGKVTKNGGWEVAEVVRRPYNIGVTYKGVSLYWSKSENVNHILFEASGQGCETLRSMALLDDIIIQTGDKCSRIDLAIDIETETKPSQFEKEITSGRFKARGYQTSDTGDTVYIGSRKSERYCRVYRYNPPHPRAKYLRTEFVFRKQNAKLFCQQFENSGGNLNALALGAGNVYGFEHQDWDLRGEEIELMSYTPERRQGKTVRWLLTQVAPAFHKLVEDGVIENPVEFLAEHFLKDAN